MHSQSLSCSGKTHEMMNLMSPQPAQDEHFIMKPRDTPTHKHTISSEINASCTFTFMHLADT